jgi:hypothetical protein
MKKEVFYSEVQQFKQWWIWLILSGINGMFVFGIITQVFLGKQFGDKPMSNAGLLIIFAVSLSVTVFVLYLRLETVLSTDGIFIRFYPLQFKYRFYNWESTKKVYIRQYSPIFEYGGWGVRYSFTGKGRAFNVEGNIGLQLEFLNGEKVLVGTQNPEKLRYVLEQLKVYKV